MRTKRAFFGTFWRGGLGAVGRALLAASEVRKLGFACYFFAEGVTEDLVREAGFIPLRPPAVDPPAQPFQHPYVSGKRIVDVGATFANLDHFYAMRGYGDADYVQRAFETRFRLIRSIDPDILFGYWSWETTIAARLMQRPLVTMIQRCLHPAGGGFADVSAPDGNFRSVHSFNRLLAKLHLPQIRTVEELMLGDLTLISGVPSTDPLPADHRTRYCGPLLWFPSRSQEQLKQIPAGRRVTWVYATDDDSWVGGRFLIREVIPILIDTGLFVLIGSGGYPPPSVRGPAVLCAKHLPGQTVARRARLVIGRGGHDLFWTAIMAGTPFFGVPPNTEWLHYCRCARSLGVGDYVEVSKFCREEVVRRIERLTSSPDITRKIRKLRSEAIQCAESASLVNILQESFPQLF